MGDEHDTEVLAQGRFARFVRREDWEFVERSHLKGIVAIVAVTEQDELLMVEQYRPPVGRRVIELPAGLAGDEPELADEPLSEAARRELLEETGYEAEELIEIGEGTASAGIVDEVITFFGARGLRRVGPGGGDDSEEIEVHRVPVSRLHDWLAPRLQAGALVDLKLFAGLHLWQSKVRMLDGTEADPAG